MWKTWLPLFRYMTLFFYCRQLLAVQIDLKGASSEPQNGLEIPICPTRWLRHGAFPRLTFLFSLSSTAVCDGSGHPHRLCSHCRKSERSHAGQQDRQIHQGEFGTPRRAGRPSASVADFSAVHTDARTGYLCSDVKRAVVQ